MFGFIVIRGAIGVGKTTIAKELETRLNGKYISIDEILDEHKLEDWEGGFISKGSFLKANEIAAGEAIKFLRGGHKVIFDGNFYWKEAILDLERRLIGYKGIVLTLIAPSEICIERESRRETNFGEEDTRKVYEKSNEFHYGTEIDARNAPDRITNDILNIITEEER